MIRTFFVFAALVTALSGCGRDPVEEQNDDAGVGGGGGTSATGGGTSGGGAGSTGGGAASGGGTATGGGGGAAGVTFCDVQPVLSAQCGSCHGPTPSSGAPVLVTRADLAALSPRGGTLLDRSIARMESLPLSTAMPPNVGGAPADVALFKAWRDAALADCQQGTGGGGGATGGGGGATTGGGGGSTTGGGGGATGGGGGTVMTTCASNLTWSFGDTTAGMNPGEACIACHTMKNKGPRDGFMGTVYPALHEAKLCMVTSVPAGVTVEILDMGGTVRSTLSVGAFSDGNFRGGTTGVPSPYRARIKVNGQLRAEMMTPQTNGDCNVCHTAQGAQGAPGRLHW